jgi:hypothetical protein
MVRAPYLVMTVPVKAWSLSEDLLRASGAGDISEALRRVRICGPECRSCKLRPEQPEWSLIGDVYCTPFTVDHDTGPPQTMILKACAGGSTLTNVGQIAEDWAARYHLLRCAGIGVPQVYWTHRGCLAEEYIPLDLDDAWRAASADLHRGIAYGIGYLCAVLTGCRFSPVRLTGLRSRGDDLVVTNVGADLGPPWTAQADSPVPADLCLALIESLQNGQQDQAIRTCFSEGHADARLALDQLRPYR